MFEWHHHGRSFQIWTYTVSHGQLLLRSTKRGDGDTRVDVLFKDVGAMSLPAALSNLEISECSLEDAGLGEMGSLAKGRRGFVLHAQEFKGWVIAGAVFVHEDNGEYYAPSPLLPS